MRKLWTLILLLLINISGGSAQTVYSGRSFNLTLGGFTFGSISDQYCYKGTIVLTSKHAATVNFLYNFNGTTATYNVQPGVPEYVFLDHATTGWISNILVEQVSNRSLTITSDSNITVQFGNRASHTEDAITVLPFDVQERATEYYVLGLRGGSGGNFGVMPFAIVANCDNVLLEITPSAQSYAHPAGVPYTVTLNKGQTYELGTPYQSSPGKDISGSRIRILSSTCCFPINVYTTYPTVYAKYPQVSSTFSCCADQIMEQNLPADWWHDEYPVMPFYKNVKSMIRAVSRTAGNVIRIDGVPVATLNAGQIFDTVVFDGVVITGDSAFGMAHFMLSEQTDTVEDNGDPAMLWCFPMQRGIREAYIPVLRPIVNGALDDHHLSIISETANVPSVMLNNAPLASQFLPFANNPNYQYLHMSLDTSTFYYLTSNDPVIAFYGAVYEQGSYILPVADLNGGSVQGSFNDTVIFCGGGGVTLQGDTLATSYQWSTGETTQTITVTATGVYTLHETFDCGTPHDHIFNVQVFGISLQDTLVCGGVPVQVSAWGDASGTYQWTPVDGVSDPTIINPVITIDTTTTFTVLASYPGCPDTTATMTIAVEPTPVVSLGNDTSNCFGEMLWLHAGVTPTWFTNYSYAWSPAGSVSNSTTADAVFTDGQDAVLTFTATTPLGCTGSDSIFIKVGGGGFGAVTPADTGICPYDSVQYEATGGVSYQWSPARYLNDSASATPVARPVTGVGYEVYITDQYGCKDTVYAYLDVYPAAVIHLVDSATIYPGESYHIDPGGNCLYFSWFPPFGLSAADIADPVASPTVNTRYFTTGRTEHGCVTSDSIDIYVSDETLLDLPNAFTPGSDPNATFMIIKRGIATLKTFQVFNRWGNKVFETTDINEGWDGRFNNIPQPMGVYVYVVEAFTSTGKRFYKQGNVTLLR